VNTEIIFVIDRSGSMSSLNAAACAGFNSFIDEQRTVAGNARVSLVFFNDFVRNEFGPAPIERVAKLSSIQPSGMTAMYDGIGKAIDEHSLRISREHWARQVIFVTITDGHENSSRSYTLHKVAGMINEMRSAGWQFIFMGANIDAAATARSMNMDDATAYQFDATAAGVQNVYAQASAQTKAMRSWGL
jgi:Mg-chelatase subunit ChlD